MEVTWPLQVREEQVRSLLVLVVVAMTALIIAIFIMVRTMIVMKRPAPQAFARPGDFVLFLLGMLMFT